MFNSLRLILLLACLLSGSNSPFAQELYSARGYWTETNQDTYKKIKQKKEQGDTLSESEIAYLNDYEIHLYTYYKRMPETEKIKYEQLKSRWDGELVSATANKLDDFDFRPRDRFNNGIYGFYYGASLAALANIESSATVGISFITAGLWQLGPVINPKKYDGITYNTLRAGNSGKFLGLLYGATLASALGGDSESTGDLALGLSTVGSIALGEVAFQYEKRKKISEGRIEMLRHYGLLTPGITLLGLAAAQSDNSNLIGASLLASGIGGLIIGNKVGKKYDYTAGDVNVIGSLTLITTGLGFTIAAESVDTGDPSTLLLIPAATAIAGTVFGQQMVRGVSLTKKQGSAINLASGGGALIGFGVMAMVESDSPGLIIGVPSALALIAHQAMFHSYKMKNLVSNIKLGVGKKRPLHFSMRVTPENYLTNKKLSERIYTAGTFPRLAEPVVKLKITF